MVTCESVDRTLAEHKRRDPPILITGSHRSGTTWVGRMLCLSGEAGYISEPFKVEQRPGWAKKQLPHWFQYICYENEAEFKSIMENVISFRYPVISKVREIHNLRHIGRIGRDFMLSIRYRTFRIRPLIKDPIALFSVEWLSSRFKVQPVVMIRHPAAFASSLKRLGWTFNFRDLLDQKLLMRDYLHPFETQIREHVNCEHDIIDQAILLWNIMYSVVYRYQQKHPSWLYVKHENLAEKPVDGFRELYEKLGLRWNRKVEMQILEYTNPNNLGEAPLEDPLLIKRNSKVAKITWSSRMTKTEIERVHAGVAEIARWFYTETEWETA